VTFGNGSSDTFSVMASTLRVASALVLRALASVVIAGQTPQAFDFSRAS